MKGRGKKRGGPKKFKFRESKRPKFLKLEAAAKQQQKQAQQAGYIPTVESSGSDSEEETPSAYKSLLCALGGTACVGGAGSDAGSSAGESECSDETGGDSSVDEEAIDGFEESDGDDFDGDEDDEIDDDVDGSNVGEDNKESTTGRRQKNQSINKAASEPKSKVDDVDADSAIAAAATALYSARFGFNAVDSRVLATTVLPFSPIPELCTSDKVVAYAAGVCPNPGIDANLPNISAALQLRPSVSQRLMSLLHCSKLTIKPLRRAAAQDIERWKRLNTPDVDQGEDDTNIGVAALSSSQSADVSIVAQALKHYVDVIYTKRDCNVGPVLSRVVCAHIVNTLISARHVVMRNDDRIRASSSGTDSLGDGIRDQGYSRARVLVLVPFKCSAVRVVNAILDACPGAAGDISGYERFLEEFDVVDEDDATDIAKRVCKRPDDHIELLAGNPDDCFRLGIRVNRQNVKLFAPFETSDIIVASPLGLKLVLGEAESKSYRPDALASLEILFIDQLEAIFMQNPSHLHDVLQACNCIPPKSRGTDFSRLREWMLDGHAKFARQTVVLSGYQNADLNAMCSRWLHNKWGALRVSSVHSGVIASIVTKVRQIFQRIECSALEKEPAERFEFFLRNICCSVLASAQKHTIIFIRSYFDFVRLRNYLKAEKASFVSLSEYSKSSDVARSRARFFQGERALMLVTERFWFFRRPQLRGGVHAIFYSLPDCSVFYKEVVNALPRGGGSVLSLITKYDKYQLEGVLGTQRAVAVLSSGRDAHEFH